MFDGWPINKAHIDLLTKYHVLPVCVMELVVSDQEMLRRAEVDREAKDQPYPVHDSASIMLIRGGHYRKHLDSVRDWYQQQHDNWCTVDGERNKWFVWTQTSERALQSSRQIQLYLSRVTTGERERQTYIFCRSRDGKNLEVEEVWSVAIQDLENSAMNGYM